METIPDIPDHDVLRVIGRGAFGEIWLARGMTGALRAVKIVYRSTFEDERSFHREFDGMSEFEPFSREHPGFVDVLHVGRDPDDAFFYYIMELADDVEGEAPLEEDRETYQPRTLRSDLEKRRRLPAHEVVDLGASIAGALGELHENNLAHRDIKPANIIFVEGKPKIADIGLVCATGQQTFVGTEGYVPPEGPGTPSSDLYSLGKVLYELSTGRDRLDFPALPEEIDNFSDKKILLRLNSVLLKACARDTDRRYQSAYEMERDLRKITAPPPKKNYTWPVVICALIAGLLGLVKLVFFPSPAPATPGKPASVEVITQPAGATVILESAVLASPARFKKVLPGMHKLHVMRAGFEPVDRDLIIESGKDVRISDLTLKRSLGGIEIRTQPGGARVTLTGPIEPSGLEKPLQRDGVEPLSLRDLPTGKYRVTAQLAASQVEETVEVTAGETGSALLHFTNGSLKITSAPLGASVIQNGIEIGVTPLLIEDLTPGQVLYGLRKSGYRETFVEGKIEAASQTFLAARLEKDSIVEVGKPFSNSLRMQFVPLGDIWIAVTETTTGCYWTYTAATGAAWKPPDFDLPENHPIVNVNWEECAAFCKWLTDRERAAGRIGNDVEYRLPTDAEWSRAAMLSDEGGETPEARDGRDKNWFPWGKTWPPPADAGNFGIAQDGYVQTAPAECFAPNALGIYNLAGNVWEWCLDSYNAGNRDWGVLRGGSWATKKRAELLASYRNVIDRTERDVIYGFRCVLAPVAATPSSP